MFSYPNSRRPSSHDEENKKKRNRKALSCIQCKTRKIKCDRGEPQCQSCIIRGIRGECKYGSLKEERESTLDENRNSHSSRKHNKSTHRNKRHSASRSDRNGSPDVDHIVNAVLKRLKRRKSSITSQSSSSSEEEESEERGINTRKSSETTIALTSSSPAKKYSRDVMEMLYYTVKNPPNTVARKVHLTAFGGYRPPDLFFPVTIERNTLIDTSDLLASLKRLPTREAVEALVDSYLQELEPARGLFSVPILRQQIKDFWQDFDLLMIQGHRLPPFDGHIEELRLRTGAVSEDDKSWNDLRCLPRQGFVAVLFRLIEAGGRLMSLDEKIRIGILPIGADEENACQWYGKMSIASALHSEASKSAELPTLWTLQLIKLNDFGSTAMIKSISEKHPNIFGPAHLQQSNVGAMQICVTLGLNRLGSGYDEAAEPTASLQRVPETDVTTAFAEHIVAQSNSLPNKQQLLTSSMKFGSSITVFEQGNFPYRELGRKIWTSVVGWDALFSGHINQHNYINDSIDRSSPPLPLTDEDHFSPQLSRLASQCRPDGARINENVYTAYSTAFSKVRRQMVEWENEKGAPLPYDDTLKLDQRFFDLFESLPPFLSLNAPISQNPNAEERRVMLQRGLLNDQAHFRLIHIHRSYLGKGFNDEKYQRSLLSCLTAAYGVLESRRVLEKASCVFVRAIYLESHLIHASLVFQLVLLHELDRVQEDKQQFGRTFKRSNNTGVGYGLIDIDKTVAILEECLNLLNPSSELPSLKEYVPGLKSFLKGAKERIRRQRGEQHDTSDAANILASMPTSAVSNIERQTSSTGNTFSDQIQSTQQQQQGWSSTGINGVGQVIDPATNGDYDDQMPSVNVYDPSIWSLDALFPNYMDGDIDLIAALESELMFTGSGSK